VSKKVTASPNQGGRPSAGRLRSYTPADRAACLAILESNVPRYFAPAERAQFAAWLDAPAGFYGVLCVEGEAPVGCGGIVRAKESARAAVLTWGMIHADHHRQGWGRVLLQARLARLAEMPDVNTVILNTSGAAAGFYRRFGFREVSIIPNGYGPGIDRYEMELPAEALQINSPRPAHSRPGCPAPGTAER
jgi:ribosomal protein S18 acetylase RimI-like enzyme